MLDRYPFLEFSDSTPRDEPGALLILRDEIGGRFWLHLGRGCQFFAPERFIGRLTAVLAAEPNVVQVAINYGDAATLTGASAPEDVVHRTADAGRYVLTDAVARGPAMFDTERLDRATAASRSASLDEVPASRAGNTITAAAPTSVAASQVSCRILRDGMRTRFLADATLIRYGACT